MAGGLAGLEERIEPPEPVTNLPWGLPEGYAAAAGVDHCRG